MKQLPDPVLSSLQAAQGVARRLRARWQLGPAPRAPAGGAAGSAAAVRQQRRQRKVFAWGVQRRGSAADAGGEPLTENLRCSLPCLHSWILAWAEATCFARCAGLQSGHLSYRIQAALCPCPHVQRLCHTESRLMELVGHIGGQLHRIRTGVEPHNPGGWLMGCMSHFAW